MIQVLPRGYLLTQGFGCTTYAGEWADPDCPSGHFHTGLDLGAGLGDPVLATAAGVVIKVGIDYLGPCAVGLRLEDGSALIYGHLDTALVAAGDRVSAGQQLGTVGSKGNSSGPHLHFAHRLDGQPLELYPGPYVDPSPYVQGDDHVALEQSDIDAIAQAVSDKLAPAIGPILTILTDGGRTDGDTTDVYLPRKLDELEAAVKAIPAPAPAPTGPVGPPARLPTHTRTGTLTATPQP